MRNCWLCRHFVYGTDTYMCKLEAEGFDPEDTERGCPGFETVMKEEA